MEGRVGRQRELPTCAPQPYVFQVWIIWYGTGTGMGMGMGKRRAPLRSESVDRERLAGKREMGNLTYAYVRPPGEYYCHCHCHCHSYSHCPGSLLRAHSMHGNIVGVQRGAVAVQQKLMNEYMLKAMRETSERIK